MKPTKLLPKTMNKKDDDSDDENIIMMEQEIDDNHMINIDSLTSPTELEIKEYRRVKVPDHRYTPLKKDWEKIVTTIVTNLDLDIRMNAKKRCVELRTNKDTKDKLNIQKAADFLKSFMLGFDLNDSIAMLRLNDLYLESFEIRDVKPLHGEHLSRCIGRISGEKGKTKNAIENATRTRIVLADSKIHIMGSYGNIRHCRAAVCNLILGSPAGKVYSQLRYIAQRYKDHA